MLQVKADKLAKDAEFYQSSLTPSAKNCWNFVYCLTSHVPSAHIIIITDGNVLFLRQNPTFLADGLPSVKNVQCVNSTHNEGIFKIIHTHRFDSGNPCSIPSALAKMANATLKLISLININSVNYHFFQTSDDLCTYPDIYTHVISADIT